MKILLIAYYYPPINSGGSVRPEKMAKYLSKFGHNVTVLTQSYKRTDFNQKNIIRIYDISHNKDRKGINKIKWLLLRSFTEILNLLGIYYSIYSLWKRNVIKYEKKIIEQVNPDIIITTYPPVETLEIGLLFSKKYKIPLISDFRDGLLFEPIEKKRIKKYKCIRKKYEKIEKQIVNHSSSIISVSNPVTKYFKNEYKIDDIFTVYTGYDPEDYLDISSKEIITNNNFFKIVYTGRLNLSDSSNRIGSFFEAVSKMIEQDTDLASKIKIYLAGEFSVEELKSLNDLINKKVVVNCGYLNRKDAIIMQRQADLLLLITSITRSSIVTTKIFEYLRSSKPILALTHKTELGKIIKDTKTGWIIHPQKIESIKKLLEKIIKDTEFYNSIKPDFKKINFYSIEEQIKQLNLIIKRTLNKKKGGSLELINNSTCL